MKNHQDRNKYIFIIYKRYCTTCLINKSEYSNVHHCSDCEICVRDYDHHCPWYE